MDAAGLGARIIARACEGRRLRVASSRSACYERSDIVSLHMRLVDRRDTRGA
jgi:hypothetical protein